MRNLKFMRQGVVLLGFVVLRTKARNRFCPMCTKGCYIVLTRSKPFWGQFWGQIRETDSDLHRSNKCAALVSLRNGKYEHHWVLAQEKPHELIVKFYSLARSCTQPLLRAIPTHRPCRREKRPCLGAFASYRRGSRPAIYCPKIPAFRGFFILPQWHLPKQDFPVQVNPTQINTK